MGVLSEETCRDHAYLIARGVRALALLGRCNADADTMLRVATELEHHAEPGAIPVVVDRRDGVAEYGYAAGEWVVDLLGWVHQTAAIPEHQRHRIIGLMLGYNVPAIRGFEEERSGRRFDPPPRASVAG